MRLAFARYCVLLRLALCSFDAESRVLVADNLFQVKHRQNSQHAAEAILPEELFVVVAREPNASLLEDLPATRMRNLTLAGVVVGCITALIILVSNFLRPSGGKCSDKEDRQGDTDGPGWKMVMSRFKMMTSKRAVIGEGAFSVVRKGLDTQTGEEVAIKIYKVNSDKPEELEIHLRNFKHQIGILKDLGKALEKNKVRDSGLWCTALESVKVTDVFIRLIDYSKDSSGEPGQDPEEGDFYMVQELAEHTLRDVLTQCRYEHTTLERNQIQHITRSIITIGAALHAKGFVHMDIKPENLMQVGCLWKLIDVGGCMKHGSEHSLNDDEFAFTTLMCAPELANCLIGDQDIIKITSDLDVWSVGVTIAELVALDYVFKANYMELFGQSRSEVEADFLFMKWLSDSEELPLPAQVEAFDSGFLKLLQERLLVRDVSKRSNLAQCLDDPFFDGLDDLDDLDSLKSVAPKLSMGMSIRILLKVRGWRSHAVDTSAPPGLLLGMLWKLNTDGDIKNPEHWLMRTWWVAKKGHICYFTVQGNEPRIYMDRRRLMKANIRALVTEDQAARDFAFQIQVSDELGEFEPMYFAAENETMQQKWIQTLSNMAHAVELQLGQKVAANPDFVRKLRTIQKVHSKSLVMSPRDIDAPVFKNLLWKLKEDGDQQQADHWCQCEWWVSSSGSFCYYSKKHERDFIYFNHMDLVRCTVVELPPSSAAFDNAFEVKQMQVDGCDLDTGVFAADTLELRQQIINELKKVSVLHTDRQTLAIENAKI